MGEECQYNSKSSKDRSMQTTSLKATSLLQESLTNPKESRATKAIVTKSLRRRNCTREWLRECSSWRYRKRRRRRDRWRSWQGVREWLTQRLSPLSLPTTPSHHQICSPITPTTWKFPSSNSVIYLLSSSKHLHLRTSRPIRCKLME
jgi:hypothetical protein